MRANPSKSPVVYSTFDSHVSAGAMRDVKAPLDGRVLVVATDGSRESRAATAVASVLGRRHRTTTVALRAFDYSADSGRSSVVVAPWGRSYDALDIARHLLTQELNRDIAEVETWTVRAVAGRPAHAIAAEARALDAALVVMGLRRQRPDVDVSAHDTVRQVLRESNVPVLATTGSLAGAPRKIVVGVDFGLESMRIAHAALSVLDDDGELVLAHVQADHRPGGRLRPSTALGDETSIASLERLRRALPARSNVSVEVVHERGDVAASLLASATRQHADCIAVGAPTHTLDDGVTIGVVANTLMKAGLKSLLMIPSVRRSGAAGPYAN